METTVQPRISQETNEKEAEAHIKQAAPLTQHTRNLPTYTDGSMLEAKLEQDPTTSQSAIEKTFHLGNQMEVYGAELYGIREVATHALRYCQTIGKRRDVWIFTDNQAAIMKVANLKPGPGQETAVAVAKASNDLKVLFRLW